MIIIVIIKKKKSTKPCDVKKTKFEKLTSGFTLSPFKRHSFTFIRLSEADKSN